MLRSQKTLALSITALCLCGCGGLAGKIPKSPNGNSGLNTMGNGQPASITNFSPAEGNLASAPTSITVNFSSGNLEQINLSAISNYTISCGGGTLVAQGVHSSAGMASITVDLPTITGLNAGTVCNFTVSNNLRDGLGNFVIGSHSATYVITAASVSGFGWNEAATPTQTASVGTPSGTAFMGVGANGMVLEGLAVNGSQYVDGLQGLWAQGFNSTSIFPGQAHGASAGGFSNLNCPTGYRITGVFGRAGAYIDAIGIECKTADYSQSYQSSVVGGPGGTSFELACPSGQFATDLNGVAGNYLNQMNLGCR